MATLLNAAVQVLAGGAGPGASTDVRLYASPMTLRYVGAVGDVVRFDYSFDNVRWFAGVELTLTTTLGADYSFVAGTELPQGAPIAPNRVRCTVITGNSGATATASVTAEPLTVAKPTVALTVNNNTTPGTYGDCTSVGGPRTVFYQGVAGDQSYIEGSDDGATNPYQVYPADGTTVYGASWSVVLEKVPNYLRVVRPSGTTAATCGVVANLAAGAAGGGGGAEQWTTLAVGDTAASGFIGGLSAAASVDAYSVFNVAQTTASVVLTLRNPTDATATRWAILRNTGTVIVYAYGQAIAVGAFGLFQWNGTAWGAANYAALGGNSGAVALGSLDNTIELIGAGTSFLTDDGQFSTFGRSPATAAANTLIQAGDAGMAVRSGLDIAMTHAVGSSVHLNPAGVGAGQTGRLGFRELAAGGTNEVSVRAPDALAADTAYVLPSALPTFSTQRLAGTTAGVLSWAGGTVNVQANNSSGQSIADGGGPADLTNWSEITDTASAFAPATGIFTAPVTGFYLVTAEIEFEAIAAVAGAEFSVQIWVNGAIVAAGVEICQVAAANVKRNPKVALGVQVTAGQTIVIRASQTSGSGANALTFVTIRNLLSIQLQQ